MKCPQGAVGLQTVMDSPQDSQLRSCCESPQRVHEARDWRDGARKPAPKHGWCRDRLMNFDKVAVVGDGIIVLEANCQVRMEVEGEWHRLEDSLLAIELIVERRAAERRWNIDGRPDLWQPLDELIGQCH